MQIENEEIRSNFKYIEIYQTALAAILAASCYMKKARMEDFSVLNRQITVIGTRKKD